MVSNTRENIARAIHENYRKARAGIADVKDVSMSAWESLPDNLKESNRKQANNIFEKLQRIGCSAHKVRRRRVALLTFTEEEIEIMAEMEHARWNFERLRNGWKLGKRKDITKRISPYLVPWAKLPAEVKELDREVVRRIPELLANVGLEIRRSK